MFCPDSYVTRDAMAVFLYRAFRFGEKISSVLDNAIFYKGPRPEPKIISYTNSAGNLISMLAYPGQVILFVEPSTPINTVQVLINENGGTILSQIPVLGFYLVQVPVGGEANFISTICQNSIVLHVSLNSIFTLKSSYVVDLSDTGVIDLSELIVALLSSPDPNASTIIALVENFINNHGDLVENEMNQITGLINKLKVNVSSPEWVSKPEYVPLDITLRSLAALIAGAELNNQNLIINMSFGPVAITESEEEFNNDALMLEQIKEQYRSYLYLLGNSEWVAKGKVLLVIAAGNEDIQLIENGNVTKSKRYNLTPILNDLRNEFGPLMDYVIFCGALDNSTGKIADYAVYGDGVIYGYPRNPGSSICCTPM